MRFPVLGVAISSDTEYSTFCPPEIGTGLVTVSQGLSDSIVAKQFVPSDLVGADRELARNETASDVREKPV
jgi:hypothetical protein